MNHKQYLALIEEMIEHDKRYYDEAKPLISDYEYDQKMHQLWMYEKEHPSDVHPHSPSQRVAENPTEGFKQRSHLVPMMSLANTYSAEELQSFVKRVYKGLGRTHVDFCCELKMDGAAISLVYEKGHFHRAVTRGNGRVGDDVTANLKTIPHLPLSLSGSHIPEVVEIRGEVYMSLVTFEELNHKRQEEGLEVFANPRNAAAGSLKLLDPKETAKRHLNLLCYAIAEPPKEIHTQFEVHHLLKKWGLPTAAPEHLAYSQNLEEILHFAEKVQKKRESLAFEIDGIVVKVDDLKAQALLGATGKVPRFAVAYKFAPEQAHTRILEITVQVGRTGVLTPVAELEPIFLAGSTISRATLHNQDEIQRKDIRVGDWVAIEKGGDVIPKVISVDLAKRPYNTSSWRMPHHCPLCKSPVVQLAGEIAIRCPNPKCAGQQLRRIIFFASKHAMDIDHLGEKVVEQLVEKGLIGRPSDLYLLKNQDLFKLDGFKEKSIQNLLKSLEASKHCTLAQFLMGLQIKYVGSETAELLAEHAGDIYTLMQMKEEDFLACDGIGEKTAKALAAHFRDPEHVQEVHLLLKAGVTPKPPAPKHLTTGVAGKTFVLTGILTRLPREKATALIKKGGGHVSSSVSKNTDYVVVGEDPGSKYDKAQALKVPILTEEEFLKLISFRS